MGTIVLLAAFLLAASATPVANSPGTLSENISDTDKQESSSSSTVTVSSTTHEASTGDSSKPAEQEGSTSATAVSTNSAEPDTPPQQSKEPVTTPGDADREDCRNGSKKNHIFLECSFLCQGDEMMMAPNHSVCYLSTANVTSEIRNLEGDSHTEHDAEHTGVCIDGQCVENSTLTTSTPADITPDQDASTVTGGQNEDTEEQDQAISTERNDDSDSATEHSPPQEAHPENFPGPQDPSTYVGPDQTENSSIGTNEPIAMPVALHAMP